MSLISEKTIDDFALWAEEHENKEIFPTISEKETSYYIERNTEETYIMEYSFKDMMAIRQALEEYAGLKSDNYMLRRMTVELCQSRFVSCSKTKCDGAGTLSTEENQKKQNNLPEFRYEF